MERPTALVALTAEGRREIPPAWKGLFDSMLIKPLVSTDLISLLARRPSTKARLIAWSGVDALATAT